MKEIYYCVAEDGTKFDDRWDCIAYERQLNLKKHKDDFIFLDHRKDVIPIEEVTTAEVIYIIIKNDRCAEAISKWFTNDACVDPFDGVYEQCVGTWVYGEAIDRGDEWVKLELAVEQLQTLIWELNKGAE